MTDERVAAEVAKLKVEAEEIAFRLERAKALAKQMDARAALRKKSLELAVEKEAVNLAMQRFYCEQQEITTRKAQRDEKMVLSDWRFDHTLNFVGHVGKDTVQATIDKLHMWSSMDPGCDLTIVFNSPGGSVIDGLALFDYIRFLQAKGHHVTTIALGYAASMGGILLQAGNVRVMAKGSWLGIHEVAFGAQGKIGEVEDMYEFGKRLKEQAAAIFVDRSGGKLTREQLEQGWLRKDWWLSPCEALELGLIDEIR